LSLKQVKPRRFRTVFISDVHLGYRGCSAEYLLEFLRTTECEYLYLVGDIIDIWSMKRRPYWPQAHNNVIRTILGKAKHETRVVYVPGNHDELLRDYCGMVFGNVRIESYAVHERADGRRLLVMHGDEFDGVVKYSRRLARIGSVLYDWLLRANRIVNHARRHLGFGYWSLAAFLKHKVKNAVQYISLFEQVVTYEAGKHNVDGIVCGHIHRAEINTIGDLIYGNCGDWVESYTALVEHYDGAMEIVHWAEARKSLPLSALPTAA